MPGHIRGRLLLFQVPRSLDPMQNDRVPSIHGAAWPFCLQKPVRNQSNPLRQQGTGYVVCVRSVCAYYAMVSFNSAGVERELRNIDMENSIHTLVQWAEGILCRILSTKPVLFDESLTFGDLFHDLRICGLICVHGCACQSLNAWISALPLAFSKTRPLLYM